METQIPVDEQRLCGWVTKSDRQVQDEVLMNYLISTWLYIPLIMSHDAYVTVITNVPKLKVISFWI